MKRIVCVTVLLLLCIGSAAAYEIKCDCPQEVYRGQVIELDGTSTLPPGYSTWLTLYEVQPLARQLGQVTIVIQQGGVWNAEIPTAGLEAGTYKFEIYENVENYPYSSSSDTTVLFKVIDRSGEIVISSPTTQEYRGYIDVAGRVTTEEAPPGLQITAYTPNGDAVYGPLYIRTDENGYFAETVPVESAGRYYVQFSDFKNNEERYITQVTFVLEAVVTPTPIATTAQPTAPPSAGTKVSASAQASRDVPAYFEIDTKPGTLTVTTSTGIDWRLYYLKEDGAIVKVDEAGSVAAETFTIATDGGMVYLKAHPVAEGDDGVITVTATNADAITASTGVAAQFNDPVPGGAAEETPVPVCVPLAALIILGYLLYRK
ncbi:hypothetical protein [Methanovulcanius yangii]|uniref:hypothetical protein n=1 Tax=Methanovulcanius yangii TaxID=1789227 RepID=UPI0029CA9743|nr:hypothetical protein [Methanovulcanius yangii]